MRSWETGRRNSSICVKDIRQYRLTDVANNLRMYCQATHNQTALLPKTPTCLVPAVRILCASTRNNLVSTIRHCRLSNYNRPNMPFASHTPTTTYIYSSHWETDEVTINTRKILSQMLETVANTTHGSTDVLTQVSGVETGYPQPTTAVLRSVSTPTAEAAGVLPAYVSTNTTIRHSVVPLFHSCVLNELHLYYLYLSIQTLYLSFEHRNYAHAC